MAKFRKFIMLAVIPVLLTGCLSSSDSDSSAEESRMEASAAEEASSASEDQMDITEYFTEGTILTLSIETVSQDKNVMDFVEKPIAPYVSHSIASWTPGYKIPPEPYYEDCFITLKDNGGNVFLDAAEAAVKVRGNWTTSYNKKPLRIKFSEKQNLLGLNDGAKMKNWILLAEYKDISMLRNKTALSISRELLGEDGLYAADAAFVEVVINRQYWGVYLLTELQQVNPNRVDITEPEEGYQGTDIGYFMEFDGYFMNEEPLQQFRMDYAGNEPLVPFDGNGGSGRTITPQKSSSRDPRQDVGITIKSDIYSQEQHDFIESYMNNVYQIMYAAAYKDEAYQFSSDYSSLSKADITPREAVELAVDVDSLADMYIISELTCDADIYWSSFFMDVDLGPDGDGRLRFEAPWDFDSAMGNKDRCADGKGFYAANIVPDVNNQYEAINPWLAVLMYEDWFQDIIREKWTKAYDSGVFERAYSMIENDTAFYQEAFERNYLRWDNIRNNAASGEWSRRSAQCKTHGEAAEFLEEWLHTRVEFLNDYWHVI